jgi:hypothetical protein
MIISPESSLCFNWRARIPFGLSYSRSVCLASPQLSQNLQDALRQMAPRQTLSGAISFGGKSRMATPILSLRMERVRNSQPDLVFICAYRDRVGSQA